MRNKKITAYLCTGLLLFMTPGCGNSDIESDVPAVGSVDSDTVMNANVEENNGDQPSDEANVKFQQDDEANANSQQDKEDKNENGNLSQADTVLSGDIESIGDHSVVINQIFYPSETTAVSYEDSDQKVLITVYFSEETEFEVRTVQNGGVNGEDDVETREGTFADMNVQSFVQLTGSYEGNDFYAQQAVIYQYV